MLMASDCQIVADLRDVRPTQPRLSSEVCFSILRELLGLIHMTHTHSLSLFQGSLMAMLHNVPLIQPAAEFCFLKHCRYKMFNVDVVVLPDRKLHCCSFIW